jgi:RNA polymerase sigma-70 factor (ECF subfamily)
MVERSQAETWIAQARGGDQLALAKLLGTCDPWLRARAEARMDASLKIRRDADDILQEVYLDVFRRIDQLEGCTLESFLAWAYAILDHRLIDAQRAAHCQARDVDREVRAGVGAADSYSNLLDDLYAESGTPSGVVRRAEALSALLGCLSDLSPAHRQVVELRFLEGLSVDEAAQRLGKTEGAVVALTKRALQSLRRSMDQLGDFTRGS